MEFAAPEALAESSPRFEIAGTWDFKWPLGTTIRVAFQELPPEMGVSSTDFLRAKEQVIALAQRWTLPEASGISFDFDLDTLPPPLGYRNSLTDQHRSPFLKETPAANPYDVLVSLQDLPVQRIDPFRGAGAESEEVIFPISELGSYARRSDYGAPTIFVGRFGTRLQLGFTDYFKADMSEHVVVHEFGHVLGLPHLHQHPGLLELEERPIFYKDSFDVMKLMQRDLGIDVTKAIVSGHLIDAWRGSPKYSDWVELSDTVKRWHAADGTLDSVMTLPNYKCLLRSASLDVPVPAPTTTPRALDKEAIRLMYDPTYVPA
jgi:hypothetical protein